MEHPFQNLPLSPRNAVEGWFDGETDIDWIRKRDQTFPLLVVMTNRPRAATTGTASDLQFGVQDFEADEERRKRPDGGG